MTDSLVLLRNLFELIPVIILICVFRDISTKREPPEDDYYVRIELAQKKDLELENDDDYKIER